MSEEAKLVVALLSAFVMVGVILVAVYVSIHGLPRIRGRWRSRKIRREYERKVTERALEIQAEHPEIPFACDNWPKYKSLCGQCCCISRASTALTKEQNAINEVIRATLR